MRNEGGGFAASIYRVMLESSIQVTSHQSLGTPNPWPRIPAFKLQGSGFGVQGSGFRVQGCSGGFAANRMGLRSKRIVIESASEKSSLQTDEQRELESRKMQHEGVFPCKGRSGTNRFAIKIPRLRSG